MGMRKFLLCLTVVLMLHGNSFADVIPPYVVISNAENISGGNDSVYISEGTETHLDGQPVPDITVLSRLRSTLPVNRGSIPSAENSLLNPNSPVEITARGNSVTFADWGGDDVYSVRVFDSKGELIEVNSEEDSRKYPITVNLTSTPENYYLEIMQKDTKYDTDEEPEFCYVLLRMKAGQESGQTLSRDRAVRHRLGNPVEAIGEIYRRYRKEAEDNPY